jgi:hypothetical protein
MSDAFDEWMRRNFTRDQAEGWFHIEDGLDDPLSADHVRRLIAFLHRLSGHAPGALPAGELEAIRGRLSGNAAVADTPGPWGAVTVGRMIDDQCRTLAALDSALADLAAAGGEVEALRLLVTDLVHPDGDGREAQARCYREGVEDERRRVLAVIREEERLYVESARRNDAAGHTHGGTTDAGGALTCRRLAELVESPPAPCACAQVRARKGE